MNKTGTALIFSFMVIVVLAVLCAALISRSISERFITQRYTESTRAFWLAEAGANHELKELRSNNWIPVSIETVTLSPEGQFPKQQYYVEIKSPSKIWSHGMLVFESPSRVVERIIELSFPFYENVMYVVGDIDVSGSSNSISGDVIYGGTLTGTLNIVPGTGEATQDPTISLDLLSFDILREKSKEQKNYYSDAAQFVPGSIQAPTSFWFDPDTKTTPNIIFLEKGTFNLKGNDSIHGFFVVGGEAVYDTTIKGTASVDGCIYTRGNFTDKGGGTMDVNGGVWVGGSATLKGSVSLQYNPDYMTGIQNLGINPNVKVIWRDTQNPYKLSP